MRVVWRASSATHQQHANSTPTQHFQPRPHPATPSPLFSSQAGLQEMGIERPSLIQEAAIPAMLRGGNCAVQCYTGSGKVRCWACWAAGRWPLGLGAWA